MSYLIVYSTENNRPWQPANWRTAAEKETLAEALVVLENFAQLSDDKETSYACRDNQPVITQVAIFRVRGRETFDKAPHYYHDNRDKSGWPMPASLRGLVNMVNSDSSLNVRK